MNDGVSISEFARQVGLSRTMIQKLIKTGKIPIYDDRTIPLAAGRAAFEEYDSAPKRKGGRQLGWTNARRLERQNQATAAPRPQRPPRPEPEDLKEQDIPQIPELPEAPCDDISSRKEAVEWNKKRTVARAATDIRKYEKIDIEVKKLKGELLDKSEVAAEARRVATLVKSKLVALPPRISSMCEGRTARDIEEIIEVEINNIMKELYKCKYTGDEE